MIVLALERTDLAHLCRALARYDAELRRDALRLPRALVDLRATALTAREGVRGHHSPDLDTVPHSAAVGPLTITYDRAAEVLDVSKTTVKKLVRAGRLPVVEVEGVPRVRVADLEEYVAHLEPRSTGDAQSELLDTPSQKLQDPGGPAPTPPVAGPRGQGAAAVYETRPVEDPGFEGQGVAYAGSESPTVTMVAGPSPHETPETNEPRGAA